MMLLYGSVVRNLDSVEKWAWSAGVAAAVGTTDDLGPLRHDAPSLTVCTTKASSGPAALVASMALRAAAMGMPPGACELVPVHWLARSQGWTNGMAAAWLCTQLPPNPLARPRDLASLVKHAHVHRTGAGAIRARFA